MGYHMTSTGAVLSGHRSHVDYHVHLGNISSVRSSPLYVDDIHSPSKVVCNSCLSLLLKGSLNIFALLASGPPAHSQVLSTTHLPTDNTSMMLSSPS